MGAVRGSGYGAAPISLSLEQRAESHCPLTPSMTVGRKAEGCICSAPEDSRARGALSFMKKAVFFFFQLL